MAPPGKLTGGTYKSIPLCTAEAQTGCVITYVSFRDRLAAAGHGALRQDRRRPRSPAAPTRPTLRRGRARRTATSSPRASSTDRAARVQPAWATPEPTITTPFVKTPGLVSTAVRDARRLQLHRDARECGSVGRAHRTNSRGEIAARHGLRPQLGPPPHRRRPFHGRSRSASPGSKQHGR